MFPPAAAQPSVIAPPRLPRDQPSAYSPIPQRLITDLHDNPLAIGLYGFIARLYLVAQAPVPLSVPDVLRYDPRLSRGAVLRALARLLAGGYVVEIAQPGRKTHYTPTWGRVGGSPLLWNMAQPCLGRPRHVARLRLDRRLFDICMGKLTPHTTRAAVVTRYVTAPVLSLADVGCYALMLAGVPRETPALLRLGVVQGGDARPLPSDESLLALISQRTLDLDTPTAMDTTLTVSGARRLGVTPLLTSDPATTAQPLFFVPPKMIESLIHPLIGSLIGADATNMTAAIAAVSGERRADDPPIGITWESRDPGDQAIPPPTPARHAANGGGAKPPIERAARRISPPDLALLPGTESAAALQAINVKPAQIIELAHIPLAIVAAAIADGQARPGVRDLAGWVVSLLRANRDYGWTIAPPAPAPDSPEALRAAFARYAADQAAQCVGSGDSEPDAADMACAAANEEDQRPIGMVAPPSSLVQLWNHAQAALRARLTRTDYTRWVKPAGLQSVAHGVATVSVPSVHVREGLEPYTALLCEQLAVLLGTPIQLRLVIRAVDSAPATAGNASPATQAPGGPATTVSPADAPAAAGVAPVSTPDHRPNWIGAAQWVALPAMLRAALIGSTIVDGRIQAVSPHLTRLIATRYACEVAALIERVGSGS
jgi:hypothetical protein